MQKTIENAQESEQKPKPPPVPDPFVFPIRVRKPDGIIAWQKKKAQFREQHILNSLVNQQLLADSGAERIQHERTFMDFK